MDAIFPSHLIINEQINDIEVFAEHAHAWNLRHTVLNPKMCYVDLHAVHSDFMQFGYVEQSMHIHADGETPKDAITFIMILNDGNVIQNKNIITKDHLIIMQEGSELNTLFVDPVQLITLSIHKKLFQEKFIKRFNKEFKTENKFDVWKCNPEKLKEVKKVIYQIIYEINAYPSLWQSVYCKVHIENLILNMILELTSLKCSDNSFMKVHDTAYRVHELLTKEYFANLDINTICHQLKVSQRNVYLTFQKYYKITPKQYLTSLRLSSIRNTLLTSNPKTTNINDVAKLNGFFHMSHFTKMYKNHFGELPSYTLNNS